MENTSKNRIKIFIAFIACSLMLAYLGDLASQGLKIALYISSGAMGVGSWIIPLIMYLDGKNS